MKPPNALEGRDISALIAEYISLLRYRWRLILAAGMALFALLAVLIFLMPRVYEATTTIMVDPQQVPDKYVSTTVVDDPSERLNLITQEVMSSSRLQATIEKLNLYPKVRQQKGRDEAIQLMRSKITIQTKHAGENGPSSFTITYEAGSPTVAAAVANELSDGFIQRHLQARQQSVAGTTAFLSDELAQTRHSLEEQEKEISSYRMQHLGEMPEQMQANLQALAQLQVELQSNADRLSHIDEERIVLERAPETSRQAGPLTPSSRTLLQAQIATAENQLQEMLQRYTPEHPDVVALQSRLTGLRAQLNTLPLPGSSAAPVDSGTQVRLDVLNSERSRLLDQQQVLREHIGSYQSKVDAVPLRQEELSNLTRDYESAKEHYRSLLDKTYSAQMATQLEVKQQGERFQVIDRARPPDKATSPNRPRYLSVAFLVALAFGVGLAILRERMDPRLKTQAELLRLFTGVELLGSIPRMERAHSTASSFA